VELHEVERVDAQARQRAVHRPGDVVGGQRRQRGEVGHQLRVHADLAREAVGGDEVAEQRLDAGVDVGRVEGAEAGAGVGLEHRPAVLDVRAVALGQLPAADDHPVEVGEGHGRRYRGPPCRPARSPWSARRGRRADGDGRLPRRRGIVG
jgi:hypothetical protein